MVKVYALNLIDNMCNSKLLELASLISDEKRDRICKFIRAEDAQRTLLGELLIRSIITRELHISNQDIQFKYNKYGKPYIDDKYGFFFNISHANKWVVCATDCDHIGIDIEHIKDIDMNLARRFFSKEEYQDLSNYDTPSSLDYFYDLWTIKEAYIKQKGKGLSIPLDSFTVKKTGAGFHVIGSGEKVYCKQYSIDKGYKLSVCANNDLYQEDIAFENLSSVLSHINQER